MRICAIAIVTALGFAHAALAQDEIRYPQRLDAAGFFEVHTDVGPAFVSGQPDQGALERLAADGVTTVVNLRTPGEMASLAPFDEAAAAAELGLDYLEIPIGGDAYPYRPDLVDAFAHALEDADGPVLLHCRSAARASRLWGAYLIKYAGYGAEEAIGQADAIRRGAREPIAQLLGPQLAAAIEEADPTVLGDD